MRWLWVAWRVLQWAAKRWVHLLALARNGGAGLSASGGSEEVLHLSGRGGCAGAER